MTEDETSRMFKKHDLMIKVAHCEIHGEFESQCRFGDHWTTCPQCEAIAKEKRETEAKAEEERKRLGRVHRLTRASELPLRFLDRTLDNFVADTPEKKHALAFAQQYADKFEDNNETGQCALFLGRPGTGKTHLAAGIGLNLLNREISVLYTTVGRLIRRIRSTWNRASEETEDQAIHAFARPHLLILDEIGIQYGSEAEKILLFEVLNERYENRLPTLLLSNLDKEGVAEALGERVFDRLREDNGHAVAFNWESARPKTAMKASRGESNSTTSATQQDASSSDSCSSERPFLYESDGNTFGVTVSPGGLGGSE